MLGVSLWHTVSEINFLFSFPFFRGTLEQLQSDKRMLAPLPIFPSKHPQPICDDVLYDSLRGEITRGSELVVANTLANWKKLEPNDINFSEGLARK